MSVHTFESMGTVVSVRLGARLTGSPSEGSSEALDVGATREFVAIAAAQQVFGELNARFSLYLDSSEISEIARGEVLLSAASESMRDAYAKSLLWREATNGAFTPHRPDGVLDLSGTIKAAAIAEAATAIALCGFESFSINAGGDILTRGIPDADATAAAPSDTPGQDAWVTGIVDPQNRSDLLSVVRLTPDFPAMATSGSAERGDHIWARPGSINDFLQATVIAGDIVTADVCATAIIAGGQETLDHLTAHLGIAVLVVKSNGDLLANARFPKLVAR